MLQNFILSQLINSISLQIPTVDTVHSLLTTPDEKKSACFEDIPNKLSKMVIAPSLTEIFSASIRAGVFPFEWKAIRVTPIHKAV